MKKPKFFVMTLGDGDEPSVYVVLGNAVALLWDGRLERTLMTLKDCHDLVDTGWATAH